MDSEKTIVKQVEDLLTGYQQALSKATGLLELKDQLIDLLEDELRIRKRQNTILSGIILLFALFFIIIAVLTCMI